jgi:hypothetical protein
MWTFYEEGPGFEWDGVDNDRIEVLKMGMMESLEDYGNRGKRLGIKNDGF